MNQRQNPTPTDMAAIMRTCNDIRAELEALEVKPSSVAGTTALVTHEGWYENRDGTVSWHSFRGGPYSAVGATVRDWAAVELYTRLSVEAREAYERECGREDD